MSRATTVNNVTTEEARNWIEQMLASSPIKKSKGARTNEDTSWLDENSISWANPSLNKYRYVDYSLTWIDIVVLRVSDEKAEDSTSVTFGRQNMEIEKLAKLDGVSLENAIILKDEVSGWKRKYRPEFDAGINFIRKFTGANPIRIYFYDLDRFTRNEEVANTVFSILRKQNVEIRVATMPTLNLNDDFSSIILPLLIQLAQGESKKTSLRTTGGHENRVKLGSWRNSLAPYGLTTVRKVVDGVERSYLAPGENADIVKEIFNRVHIGDSISEIVLWLNESGIAPAGNSQIWRESTLSYLLRNPHYAGYMRYNTKKTKKDKKDPLSQIVKDENGKYITFFEPIVDPKVWHAVVDIVTNRSFKKSNVHHNHILSGILYCADPLCQAHDIKMAGAIGKVRNYRCPDAKRDKARMANSISAIGLELAIKTIVMPIIDNKELFNKLATTTIITDSEIDTKKTVIENRIQKIKGYIESESDEELKKGHRLNLSNALEDLKNLNATVEVNKVYVSNALSSSDKFEEMWDSANKFSILSALKGIIKKIEIVPLGDNKKLNQHDLKRLGWLLDYNRVNIIWNNGEVTNLADELASDSGEVAA